MARMATELLYLCPDTYHTLVHLIRLLFPYFNLFTFETDVVDDDDNLHSTLFSLLYSLFSTFFLLDFLYLLFTGTRSGPGTRCIISRLTPPAAHRAAQQPNLPSR